MYFWDSFFCLKETRVGDHAVFFYFPLSLVLRSVRSSLFVDGGHLVCVWDTLLSSRDVNAPRSVQRVRIGCRFFLHLFRLLYPDTHATHTTTSLPALFSFFSAEPVTEPSAIASGWWNTVGVLWRCNGSRYSPESVRQRLDVVQQNVQGEKGYLSR